MLNGTNRLPVLDYHLIEAIAMKDLFRRGETALFECSGIYALKTFPDQQIDRNGYFKFFV